MANIILLPGFDGTGVLYAPLQAALGDDYSTLVISYHDEITFNDYVVSVASRLPPDNIVLIAESFSGPVALEIAKHYASKIKCIVLCATFAISPFNFLTRLSRFIPELFFSYNPAQEIILHRLCFERVADPSLIAKAVSVIQSVPAGTIKSRLSVLSGVNMCSTLYQVTVPVLYLQAMQDKVVSARLSQQLLSGLPDITVEKLDGPHLLFQSRPVECAALIKSFIYKCNAYGKEHDIKNL